MFAAVLAAAFGIAFGTAFGFEAPSASIGRGAQRSGGRVNELRWDGSDEMNEL